MALFVLFWHAKMPVFSTVLLSHNGAWPMLGHGLHMEQETGWKHICTGSCVSNTRLPSIHGIVNISHALVWETPGYSCWKHKQVYYCALIITFHSYNIYLIACPICKVTEGTVSFERSQPHDVLVVKVAWWSTSETTIMASISHKLAL